MGSDEKCGKMEWEGLVNEGFRLFINAAKVNGHTNYIHGKLHIRVYIISLHIRVYIISLYIMLQLNCA